MLFEKTVADVLRCSLGKIDMLTKHKLDIAQFDELCAQLLRNGNNFTAEVDADELEVNYHMHPAAHGDYLAIIEQVSQLGAKRVTCGKNFMCDIVTMTNAQTFWLHIPVDEIFPAPLTLVQAAGQSMVSDHA